MSKFRKTSSIKGIFGSARDRLNSVREKLRKLRVREKELEEEEAILESLPQKDELLIKFSLSNVAKVTLLILVLLWGAQQVQEIGSVLLLFFTSLLFSAALSPSINALEKRKVPRALSVLILFLLILTILGLFISKLIPLVASQSIELAKNLTQYIQDFLASEKLSRILESFFGIDQSDLNQDLIVGELQKQLASLSSSLQSLAGNTVSLIKSVFNGFFNFIVFLVLTFFFVIDAKKVDSFILSVIPSKHGRFVAQKGVIIKKKMGYWLQGQITTMLFIFIVSYIIFLALGLNYALTLAMLLGFVEILPIVGFFIGIIPVLLVAVNQSPWLFLWVLIAQLLLQQIQGNLITPLIMKKTVGLHPLLVIFAIMTGYTTNGLLGVIIAIPVAISLVILFESQKTQEL